MIFPSIYHSELLGSSATYGDSNFPSDKINAIKQAQVNGLALQDSLASWANDEDVVRAAISNNPLAIRFAPFFQDDYNMATLAVKKNGLARFWLSPRLKQDSCIKKLAQRTLPLQYDADPMRNRERFFLAYVAGSPFHEYIIDFTRDRFIFPSPYFIPLEDRKKVFLEDKNTSCFIRDSHVTLLEGGHLLPYPIPDLQDEHVIATLPPSAYRLFNKTFYAKGFLERNIDQAMITAYDLDIPFRRGQTCIEGGNCFLFISKGQRKAIIGEISLYLSMIALTKQGCFDGISFENISRPSLQAYRIARNLNIYEQMKETLEERTSNASKESILPSFSRLLEGPVAKASDSNSIDSERSQRILDYRDRITAPISEEDLIFFHHQAKKIEVQLQLTKSYISEELNIPAENIAFVPQTSFHIDMEMFVTPDGEVGLHDDTKVLEFLSELKRDTQLNQDEQELFELYHQTAQKKALSLYSIQEMRLKILRAHNIEVHTFPGVLKASLKSDFRSVLNYCNGIFVKEGKYLELKENSQTFYTVLKKLCFSFITTGPSSREEMVFHNKFVDIFKRTFPQIYLETVPGMSEAIARHYGGIHCMTFEDSPIINGHLEQSIYN